MGNKKILFYANAAFSYSQGSYSGINRVTYEFLEHLAGKKDFPYDFTLYTQGLKRRGSIFSDAFKRREHIFFPNTMPFPRFFSYAPLRELLCQYDLFHIPHNFDYCYRPDKTLVTLHDAMIYAYPQDFPDTGIFFNRRSELKVFLKKCRAVLTCSENSKSDILKYVDIPEEKIFVAPWGVNRMYYNTTPLTQADHEIVSLVTDGEPYFLSVSCGTGRKNTRSLITAYKYFLKNHPSHKLLLVWGDMPPEVRSECGEGGDIIILGGIDDLTLSLLYKSATALFFISKYEGFGLPLLEAMACGTPVVTCRNSSLVEIGGDAAIYVDPDDLNGIAHVMEKFENGGLDIPSLQRSVIARSEYFTWENCFEKTCFCYHMIL